MNNIPSFSESDQPDERFKDLSQEELNRVVYEDCSDSVNLKLQDWEGWYKGRAESKWPEMFKVPEYCSEGRSSFHWACYHASAKYSLAEYLVATPIEHTSHRSADIWTVCDKQQNSPLHLMLMNPVNRAKSEEIFNLLSYLLLDCDPDQRHTHEIWKEPRNTMTLIWGDTSIVKRKRKAYKSSPCLIMRNKHGELPLDLASNMDYPRIRDLLDRAQRYYHPGWVVNEDEKMLDYVCPRVEECDKMNDLEKRRMKFKKQQIRREHGFQRHDRRNRLKFPSEDINNEEFSDDDAKKDSQSMSDLRSERHRTGLVDQRPYHSEERSYDTHHTGHRSRDPRINRIYQSGSQSDYSHRRRNHSRSRSRSNNPRSRDPRRRHRSSDSRHDRYDSPHSRDRECRSEGGGSYYDPRTPPRGTGSVGSHSVMEQRTRRFDRLPRMEDRSVQSDQPRQR